MAIPSDLYRTCFDVIPDAVFIIDVIHDRIIDANAEAIRMTGFLLDELKELAFTRLFRQAELVTLIQHKDYGNRQYVEAIGITNKTGKETIVSVSAITKKCGLSHYLVVTAKETNLSCLETQANDSLWLEMKDFPNMIGTSKKIRDVCRLVGAVAKTGATVLIQGESGTGKEVIANAVHIHSHRREKPFVKVNCAALSESLLESELFGHVKGAFTGAIRDRVGRFKQADGGTILLDEIGCLSLPGQAKLLRVLQEHAFEPVGSSSTLSANVRVMAATNLDLAKAVKEGRFREDLYYRLNVFTIPSPPLRERKEDIYLLVQHFLSRMNPSLGKPVKDIANEAHTLLLEHDWPGNIRELENVIEHAVIVESSEIIAASSLPVHLVKNAKMNTGNAGSLDSGLREKLNAFEKQIVLDTLRKTKGIKKDAANLLKIDPRNLPYLMRKHQVN